MPCDLWRITKCNKWVRGYNNIKGHELRPRIKDKNYIVPIFPENFDFEYKDKYGNYKYRFENNEVIENNVTVTQEQLNDELFRKESLKKIVKALIAGIEDKNSPAYQTLKNILGV